MGAWKGHTNFSEVHMDDFEVVLGLNFLRQVTAIPMPSFSTVCILEKGSPCIVSTIESPEERAFEVKQLSAMQIAKGVKKGAPTYLAMLKVEGEPHQNNDVPHIIRKS